MSGLLITNKRPQELIGGGTTPFNILVSNGDWTDNLPEHEHQKRYDIDETYTCLFQNNGNDGKETVASSAAVIVRVGTVASAIP